MSTSKICNKEILEHVSAFTGEDPRLVRGAVEQVFDFVHARITDGGFEAVYIRKFGKFRPREKKLSQIIESRGRKETRKNIKNQSKAINHENVDTQLPAPPQADEPPVQ
jgi:nucleoid DNA-binding protein